MKRILFIVALALLLVPGPARADSLTYRQAWTGFLYDIPYTFAGGVLGQNGHYTITSGDHPSYAGPWTLELADGNGVPLAGYHFDPASLAAAGVFHLVIPYEFSGASARVTDPSGRVVVTTDLTGSRVCNDDGACASSEGENADNCPHDCGGSARSTTTTATAAISQQASFSGDIGRFLLRFGFAAAGLLMLLGIAKMLDSRR